jgi:hypothetical protein
MVKNHLGDKANFWPAVAELQADGIKVGVVVTNDDIGVPLMRLLTTVVVLASQSYLRRLWAVLQQTLQGETNWQPFL